MEEAKVHDEQDEEKRERSSQYEPVKIPASRILFPLAKQYGARIVFHPNL